MKVSYQFSLTLPIKSQNVAWKYFRLKEVSIWAIKPQLMNLRNTLRMGLFCTNMHDVWNAKCLHPLELCTQVHALCSAVKHFSLAAFLACENSRPSLLPVREDVVLWKSWKSLRVSLSCLGFLDKLGWQAHQRASANSMQESRAQLW